MAVIKPLKRNKLEVTSYFSIRNLIIKIGLLVLFVGFLMTLSLLGSISTWWVVMLFALPIYVLGEWVATRIFGPKFGWSTAQVGFSPLRILSGVCLILTVAVVGYLLFR